MCTAIKTEGKIIVRQHIKNVITGEKLARTGSTLSRTDETILRKSEGMNRASMPVNVDKYRKNFECFPLRLLVPFPPERRRTGE